MAANGDNGEDLRAAEYVLGTLEADERERFVADLRQNPELRREVAYWEEQLGQLGLLLTPVRPPQRVWERIAVRTGIARPRRRPERRMRFWQGLAVAASVAAAALATVLFLGVPVEEPGAPAYASVIHDEPTGAGWLLTAAEDEPRLTVKTIHGYPLPPDKSLHLWLLPQEGDPVSLGLMPGDGDTERMAMPEGGQEMLDEGARFAVSLEPPGGSPEPQPTGKIMWVVPVTARTG